MAVVSSALSAPFTRLEEANLCTSWTEKGFFPPQWSEAPFFPLGGVPITLLGASDWLGLCSTSRLLSFQPPLPVLGECIEAEPAPLGNQVPFRAALSCSGERGPVVWGCSARVMSAPVGLLGLVLLWALAAVALRSKWLQSRFCLGEGQQPRSPTAFFFAARCQFICPSAPSLGFAFPGDKEGEIICLTSISH